MFRGKEFFVFECKNYGGNIHGDAKREKWVQYLGRKKSYFYSPLLQNREHVEVLKGFLAESGMKVPIIPVLATITRGNWKIRNLGEGGLCAWGELPFEGFVSGAAGCGGDGEVV